MYYMIAGYLIIWLASFAFILTMVRRQTALQRELKALQEAVHEHEK